MGTISNLLPQGKEISMLSVSRCIPNMLRESQRHCKVNKSPVSAPPVRQAQRFTFSQVTTPGFQLGGGYYPSRFIIIKKSESKKRLAEAIQWSQYLHLRHL